jgi:hypothetical protein
MRQQQQISRIEAACYGAILMALTGFSVGILIFFMIVERFSLSAQEYTKWVLGSTAVSAGGGGLFGFVFPDKCSADDAITSDSDDHDESSTTSVSVANDNIPRADAENLIATNSAIN